MSTAEKKRRVTKYQNLLTEKQFIELKAELPNITDQTFDMCKQVLVHGKHPEDVLQDYPVSYPRLMQALKRVADRFDITRLPDDWVELRIIVPPALAEEIKNLAFTAQQQFRDQALNTKDQKKG